MPLPPEIQLLIERANLAVEKVYKTNPEPELTDHNVGCAVLTKSGKIYTGVNISHFVGGPCAESVALGNALQNGENGEDFTAIVAVLNRRRGVISPCGRCRQMLIDYYPGIKVVVIDRQQSLGEVPEPVVVDIGKLLPYGYVWKRDRSFQPKI